MRHFVGLLPPYTLYSILLLLYCEIVTKDYLKDAEYCQRYFCLLPGNNVSKG